MKKVALIIALSISMLAFSSKPEPPGPVIGVKIVFGKRSQDCKKFGICEITINFEVGNLFDNAQPPTEERTAYGYSSATKDARLQVKLNKAFMTRSTQGEFFNDGKFVVEEDFMLPKRVAEELGLRSGYTIRSGVYTYTETASEIILTL